MPPRERPTPFDPEPSEAPAPPGDAEARALGFDPAEVVKLPDPGGCVPRFGGPCPGCGATTFDVVRAWREARTDDGEERRWETVDARCPRCKLHSDRTARRKATIGSLDLTTGILTTTRG